MSACSELCRSNFSSFLDSVDTFMLDCDGVLWSGETIIDGVVETVNNLKAMGKRILFITNNSREPLTYYVKKCQQLGFPADENSVICTSYVIAAYLKNILKFQGKVYLMGSSGMAKELENHGIEYIGLGKDNVDENDSDALWNHIDIDPEVNCVCIGMDKYISYKKMLKASTYLKNKDCLFLVTNEDATLPHAGHMVIPGVGSIVAPVRACTGREPVVVGKPFSPMFDVLRSNYDLQPDRTVMVGDNLCTDIALAHNCGLQSLFVLTGAHTLDMAQSYQQSNSIEQQKQVPDYYIPSFGDIRTYLD